MALEKRMFAGEWTTRQTRSAFRSAYLSRFARLQDDGSLRALRNDDVRTLFDATSLASFYAGDYRMTRDLERDLEELRRRHLARTQDAVDVYESLIDDRRFTDARVFMLGRMPAGGVQPPRVVETRRIQRGPTVLFVDDTARVLYRRALSLSGATIVVAASPLCHFCRNAVSAIDAHPSLRAAFERKAIWIVGPDHGIPFAAVRDWNRSHRRERMVFAYDLGEWPMIDDWATPIFYFLGDGRLVAKVIGWPRGGRVAGLETAIRDVGL